MGLSANDRVLVKNQTAPAENGIYVVDIVGTGADGVWSRALDMQTGTNYQGGSIVPVTGPSASADETVIYSMTSPGVNTSLVVGTTAQTWVRITNPDHITREIPSGAINGTNVTFTLANTPVTGTEHVYLNGVLQDEGALNDYTISGAVITMNDAPSGAPGNPDKLLVSYLRA